MGNVQVVKVEEADVQTIPFFGTVAANSNITLVSGYITYPFMVEKLRAQFALNCNRKLRIKFYISPDDTEPVAEPLTGHNILEKLGQCDFICGDDEAVEVAYRVKVKESGMFVKIFAQNNDSYEHTIVGQIFISRLDVVVEI